MNVADRMRAAWRAFRAYEGATSTPQRRNPLGAGLSGDAAMEQAGGKLREWGRYLDENHDLVVGILDELVANTCGTGIVTIPKPLRPDGSIDEVLGARIMTEWRRWIREADVTGELSWNAAQRMACRAWMRDGEQFVRHVVDRYPVAAEQVPYRIELIESELVPLDLTMVERGWRQGVRFNEWRRPTAYGVLRAHPGDLGKLWTTQVGTTGFQDVRIVDAGEISHIKHARRWPQVRGASVLAPVISRLWDIKDLEESERIRNRVLASWTAAIERSPDMPGYEAHDLESGARYLQMAGGTVIDSLAPGESIKGVGPEYPQSGMADYIADQIRRISAGAGARFSSISRRYDGTYSAQRQEMVESQPRYQMREDEFVARVVRPVYERWLITAMLSRKITMPAGVDFLKVSNAEFRGPVTPWIDPLKEIQADALAVEKGFATQEQIQIKRGTDPSIIGQKPAAPKRPALAVVPSEDDDDEQQQEESA